MQFLKEQKQRLLLIQADGDGLDLLASEGWIAVLMHRHVGWENCIELHSTGGSEVLSCLGGTNVEQRAILAIPSGWCERIPMGVRTTADRNRQIFTAFEAGRTIMELGEDYGLSEIRIRAVVLDERHRRIVSPEPFYREIRNGNLCQS